MHALELAKTAWNAHITLEQRHDTSLIHVDMAKLIDNACHWLDIATNILRTYGSEGDHGGPLEELDTLRSLLREPGRHNECSR